MKMVSAAKYSKAEKELKQMRSYGAAANAFYEKVELEPKEENRKKHLIIATTSDRGLCGAVHSSIVKAIRVALGENKEGVDTKVVCIGDKSKSMLQRAYGGKILFSVNEIGKKTVTFTDASAITNEILNSGFEFDSGDIFYNRFKSAIQYFTTRHPFYSNSIVSTAKLFGMYDSLDEATVKSYQEFQLANMIFFALKESSTSEVSARMSAMDNASKNAGEMISKLTLYYNRTRQAVITRELIEIISGASALDVKK
jgi:F-type H+-transporting ATPase subunit gamma